ncbi:MAG: hypothetical protein V3U65_12480 [Granulosicoccaceae bacterium]
MPVLAQRGTVSPSTLPGITFKPDSDRISIETLLAIDQDYRSQAAADTLRKIAPRQLNRLGIAWLPVMNKNLHGWHFQVAFSNTLRANRLGKINDWVVIHYSPIGSTDNRGNAKATIVTETHGAHEGQRVVRGRENECHTIQTELAV